MKPTCWLSSKWIINPLVIQFSRNIINYRLKYSRISCFPQPYLPKAEYGLKKMVILNSHELLLDHQQVIKKQKKVILSRSHLNTMKILLSKKRYSIATSLTTPRNKCCFVWECPFRKIALPAIQTVRNVFRKFLSTKRF